MDHLKQSCYELSLPVTEKSNLISRDIDRAHSKQMVQILKRCDAEIFEKKINHEPFYQTLYSVPVIQTMVDVAKRVEMILRDQEESLIVLSGCGTSGRIAFLLVSSFNEMLKAQRQKQICSYIIAGGDRALLTSREAPEDDPGLGARMLEKVSAGAESEHKQCNAALPYTLRKKSCHWGCTFSKGTLLYPKATYWYLSGTY
ncbi:glucokinase regulatory protein [Pimephales promelas]|nr:glucokinase regulatory protein [Pimephales promelas]